MKTGEKGNFTVMVSKIEKAGNKITIMGERFEVEVCLQKPQLIIKMITFDNEIYSGTFYQATIQEGEQNSKYRDLMRDFQYVERIFQCFTNENYFLIDPRLATIFIRLQEEVRINGFQRKRQQNHIIHLEQTPMTDFQKIFLKLMKMQEEIRELKGVKSSQLKEDKQKHLQEVDDKLKEKYLYLRKKSNEQQKQIDFLMQKIGENVRVEYRQKKKMAIRSKKLVKNAKEATKILSKVKKDENKQKLKAYKQSSSDEDSSSCSSSSSESSCEENNKPIKRVKTQQRKSLSVSKQQNIKRQKISEERKEREAPKKNVEIEMRKKQSEVSEEINKQFWKGIDLRKSLVFYNRNAFVVHPEYSNRIVFKGGESRWMQCVLNRQIFEQQKRVFDFRIVRTKYRKMMIGIVSNSRMRDLSSYRTGKSITYRSEDCIIKQGELQKKSGRGFGEKDYVRMIVELKNRKIEWKVGSSRNNLITEAVCLIPQHIIRDGVYLNFQMYNQGDQIQIIQQ